MKQHSKFVSLSMNNVKIDSGSKIYFNHIPPPPPHSLCDTVLFAVSLLLEKYDETLRITTQNIYISFKDHLDYFKIGHHLLKRFWMLNSCNKSYMQYSLINMQYKYTYTKIFTCFIKDLVFIVKWVTSTFLLCALLSVCVFSKWRVLK